MGDEPVKNVAVVLILLVIFGFFGFILHTSLEASRERQEAKKEVEETREHRATCLLSCLDNDKTRTHCLDACGATVQDLKYLFNEWLPEFE